MARRIAVYMLECADQQINIEFFKGLGMALAVVYEELTGRTAANKKPQEILQWAKDLPPVRYPHVTGS